jgi:hypothetical protein
MHEGHDSIATWAWIFPPLVLLYRMLECHTPSSSVLYGSSITGSSEVFLRYCEGHADLAESTCQRPYSRVGATVTAPFYAGLANSAGALASKHQVLAKLFTFEKHDEASVQQNS